MSSILRSGGSWQKWLLIPTVLIITLATVTGGLAEGAGSDWQEAPRLQDSEPTQTPTPPEDKVEPGLRSAILAAPGGQAEFLVYLAPQADLGGAYLIDNWTARGQFVLDTLRETARASQAGLLESLSMLQAVGMVADYRPYFIVNAIGVTGDVQALDALAARPEVDFIESMKLYSIPEPDPGSAIGTAAVEWGVQRIGADRVWAEFGVRGQGIVVATIDTGALHTHPALNSRYRGTLTGSHDYSWFDPQGSTAPFDNHGHGTHVVGTMIGDDGGSNQIGIAPQATWIAAKGCATNSCSSQDLLASAEWILAPYPIGGTSNDGDPSQRPHVVNNSWGGPGGDLWYRLSVQAWRAANIFPAFAAGNTGPSTGSINSPGDYAESFASGATNSSDAIASFSSRGPSSLTVETKPDVSSPGVSIRSSWNNGGYNTISGTSMASPHTAGCVALIRASNGDLDVAQVEDLLTSTALDLGAAGPDTSYGFGLIDCYAAVAAAALPTPTPGPTSTAPSPTAVPPTLTPITPTSTPITPPATHTPTPVPPGPTNTPVPITPTHTSTWTPAPITPTHTSTWTPTPITPTHTSTWTPTPITPTATQSAVPPSPTTTPSPTVLPTDTPDVPSPTPTFPSPTSTPAPEIVFFDSFENDRGWVRDPFGTDTATTGLWERADPEDTFWGQPLQLGTTLSGTQDLVTGALAGSGPGAHDVDGGVTSIRSPDINLPAQGEIRLAFFYYLAHLNNSSSVDFLRVRVVSNGSSSIVFQELGSADNDSGAWAYFSTSLNAFAGQTIYLLVEAADAGTPSLVEAALEDVAITVAGGIPPTPTPPPTSTPVPPTHTPVIPSPTGTPPPPTPTSTPEVIFFDDFEVERGWQRDPFGADSATTGWWERADPQETSWGQQLQLGTTVSGMHDLVTGPLAGSGTGEHDVDGGATSIRSPDIHLPAGKAIELSFSFYLAHLSNSSAEDYLRVRVYGTVSDATVFEELGAAENDFGVWESISLSLDSFSGQTIYLVVEAADAGAPSLVEAAIDDLSLRADG